MPTSLIDKYIRKMAAEKLKKRIAILSGGGDVPGLNAAIKSFVWRATDEGHEVLGLRRGCGITR